jgi:hypothetical protein
MSAISSKSSEKTALVYYFLTNLCTTAETFIGYYACRCNDPFIIHKSTYSGPFLNRLNEDYELLFYQMHFPVADILWQLQGESRLNIRNFYYLFGEKHLGVNEKEMPLFLELIIRRSNLLKAYQPLFDEAYDRKDIISFTSYDQDRYSSPLFIENSHNPVSEKDEFVGIDFCPDIFPLILKLDEYLDERFNLSDKINPLINISFNQELWPKLKNHIIYDLFLFDVDVEDEVIGVSEQINQSPAIVKKSIFTFTDLSQWDHELNTAAKKFKKQNGFWPNIMQASDITYRKIELVANSKPQKIKGDGSDGMPLIPSHFVELAGFQGEGYSLEMCNDEELKELEFRLIYDSDPDGEFYVEPEDLEKAV